MSTQQIFCTNLFDIEKIIFRGDFTQRHNLDAIGHTAGVVPKGDITEQRAAENLIADVLNVEQRLAVCVPVDMPPRVYNSLVSFAFNVGTGAACRSTLVSYIKRHQWWQACDQLTRWVYVNGTKNKGLENRRARSGLTA